MHLSSAEWAAKISSFPCHWGEVESPNPNPPSWSRHLLPCILNPQRQSGCFSPWGKALWLVTRCQNLHEIPPGRGTGAHVSSMTEQHSSVFCPVILSVLAQLLSGQCQPWQTKNIYCPGRLRSSYYFVLCNHSFRGQSTAETQALGSRVQGLVLL